MEHAIITCETHQYSLHQRKFCALAADMGIFYPSYNNLGSIAQCEWDERTCRGAAWSGQLEMLRWVRARGCPSLGSTDVCAFRSIERGCGHPWTLGDPPEVLGTRLCVGVRYLCQCGLVWIFERCSIMSPNGCPSNSTTCTNAALNGHLELLI
jgi:hypothetical protein